MVAIPSEKCNNQVILMGRVTGVVEATGNQTAYAWLTVGEAQFQLDFHTSLFVPEYLSDRNIRVIGSLFSGYKGDITVKVTGYRMTTRHGEYRKLKPKEWDGPWPTKWSE